jgi:hypothetical protein
MSAEECCGAVSSVRFKGLLSEVGAFVVTAVVAILKLRVEADDDQRKWTRRGIVRRMRIRRTREKNTNCSASGGRWLNVDAPMMSFHCGGSL